MPEPRRLVLLATSHRVAPGLLSAAAWDALRSAAQVVALDGGHPLAPYVAEAGAPPVQPLGADAAQSPARLAAALVAAARGSEGAVVYLGGDDGDPGLAPALSAELVRDPGGAVEVEVLHGSWDVPGARLLDLVAVMDRLRSPGGCPWDAGQTHASLVTYLLEEAYETVEAIEAGDDAMLREELGDLLLQVVFHARIAEERETAPWSVDDVAAGIVEKLVRRHPHVFADVHAPTAEHVEANWELIKAEEKARTSAVDGVPLAQPALALAAKLLSRAAKAGVEVQMPEPADRSAEALGPASYASEEALGEALLAVVARARGEGLDPERALREASRRYAGAVRVAETRDTGAAQS